MVNQTLIELLNRALAWELRAIALYSHYAAYVRGIDRLHLSPKFAGEAAESIGHAQQVRDAIVKLGGVAARTPADVEIVHTESTDKMLEEALLTEQQAARIYREVLDEIDPEEELFDTIQQIQFAEERSVDELKMLIPIP